SCAGCGPGPLSPRTELASTFLRQGRRRCQPAPCSHGAGLGGEFATSGEQVANSPAPLSHCDSSTWATPRGEFASSPLVPGPRRRPRSWGPALREAKRWLALPPAPADLLPSSVRVFSAPAP